ncbi:MAG: hypothetical protein KG012_01665 [Deltaproteobacteria bacterium]|nr:hypothetical protein [Deltaproteobacteria bacterium]
MNANQALSICQVEEEARRVEINPKRVAEWVLIFTNIFFVSYFFGRLLKIF